MPAKKALGILALAGVNPYVEKANEEYMNADQLEHFRKILDAWRTQLREEVDRTVTHMKTKPQTSLIRLIAQLKKKSLV